MKPVNLLFASLFLAGGVYAGSQDHHGHDHSQGISTVQLSAGAVDPAGEEINVNVFGLVCDFCAQAIEKVFMKREEVSGIRVDLAGGLVSIYTRRGMQLPDATLKKLIVDAGYNVDSINRK